MNFKAYHYFVILLFICFAGGTALAQVPANTATAVSATTNFTFAGVTTQAGEFLQISTGSAFATLVLDKNLALIGTAGYTFSASDLIGTLLGHTQLDNNTVYYWRVVDPTQTVVLEPGAFYSFTTILGPPTSVAATSITLSGFSANWTANTFGGATSYILRVGTTSGGTDIVNDVNVGNVLTYSLSGLTANTAYYYSVKASDGTNITASSNEITATTLLGPPTATAASFISSTSFSANWTANIHGGATGYILRVGTTSGGTDIINDVNEGNVLTKNVIGLLANTTYYYSVKATDGTNITSSSNEITVTTLTAPVTLTAPLNGITGVSVLPTFSWLDIFDETTFTVKISTAGSSQAAFDAAVIATKVTAQNAVSYATLATDLGLPLSNGTVYYWQVSVQGGSSNNVTSAIYHFTTTQAFTVNLSTPVGTVFTTPATFSWYINSSTAGLQYILQYKYSLTAPANSEDEAFWSALDPAVTTLPATTNLSVVSAIIYGKTYYWRVLAQRTTAPNDYVYYPMADVYGTFITAGGSAITVYPSWPLAGNTVYTNAPQLDWYPSQFSPGLIYQVRYSSAATVDGNGMLTDVSSISIPTDVNILTATSNLFETLPALTPGATYYWEVRAYYPGTLTYSNWSSVQGFVTAGVGTPVVAVPSYPVAGETIYTTAPTLYWYLNTPSSGLYYDVDLSTDPNFGTHVLGYPITTLVQDQLSYPAAGLTAGVTYYWRVRSNNLSATSAWSESLPVTNATFTVAGGAVASFPVATWPIGLTPPVIYTTQPVLNWYLEGSSVGFVKYTVKWYKGLGTPPGGWTAFNNSGNGNNSDGGVVDVTPVTTTTLTMPTALNYGSTYYWAVALYDGTSYSNWSEGSFGIVGGSIGAGIALSQPTDGATVYSTTEALSWYINGSIVGLDHYSLEYSQSDTHSPSTIVSPILPASPTSTISSLTPGATYYWRVTATYADATVFTSVWFSFTVNTGSPSIVMPIVGSPNHVQVNTSEPMMTWALPAPSVNNTSYELLVASDPSFSNAKTYSSTKSFMKLSGLSSGSSYYWKVRSKDAGGNASSYSGMGQFKVGSVTAVDNSKLTLPTSYTVSQNYPNPFNPSTSIQYALPKSSMVTIKVYNMLGQEVRTLTSEVKQAGYYSVQWNGDNNLGQPVSSGIYIYRVTAGQYFKTMKMVLLK
jgi:hypothetical protein